MGTSVRNLISTSATQTFQVVIKSLSLSFTNSVISAYLGFPVHPANIDRTARRMPQPSRPHDGGQPDQAEVSDLIESFSSFLSADAADTRERPRPGGHGESIGAPTRRLSHDQLSGDSESGVSTDKDFSSDEDSDCNAFDRRRQDAIDRIMKSFCASLDSKIATISPVTAKSDLEPTKLSSPVGTKGEAIPIARLSRRSRRGDVPSELSPQPSTAGPATGPSLQSRADITVPRAARATMRRVVGLQAQGQIPQATVSGPSPLTPSPELRGHPPAPPRASAPGLGALSDQLSPGAPAPPIPATSIAGAPRPRGPSTSRVSDLVEESDHSLSTSSDKIPSTFPRAAQPPARVLKKRGQQPSGQRQWQEEESARNLASQSEAGSFGSHPWETQGRESHSSLLGNAPAPSTELGVGRTQVREAPSAIPYVPLVRQDARRNYGHLGPEGFLGPPSASGLPGVMPVLPHSPTFDGTHPGGGILPDPFIQMVTAPLLHTAIPEPQERRTLATPPEDSPDRYEHAPATKRAADGESSGRGGENFIPASADGDGRRKKAKRTPSGSVTGPTGKKFACPYFKRNPRKYRNWTSCPGPGWEEVHRVKYVVCYPT